MDRAAITMEGLLPAKRLLPSRCAEQAADSGVGAGIGKHCHRRPAIVPPMIGAANASTWRTASSSNPRRFTADGSPGDLPRWACRWVERAASRTERLSLELTRTDRSRDGLGLRSLVLHGALHLSPEDFEAQATRAYLALLEGLDGHSIVRVWNFVPGITERIDAGRNRYMAFNAARFSVLCDATRGRPTAFPVASGVGHSGSDLVLHLLHGAVLVVPFANPRQRAPERYSVRYGKRPPLFTRAALVTLPARERWLVVAGTASVVDEDSTHASDFEAQLGETLANLESLVAEISRTSDISIRPEGLANWLAYIAEPRHEPSLRAALMARGLAVAGVEIRSQDLCREELLVEIECAGRID